MLSSVSAVFYVSCFALACVFAQFFIPNWVDFKEPFSKENSKNEWNSTQHSKYWANTAENANSSSFRFLRFILVRERKKGGQRVKGGGEGGWKLVPLHRRFTRNLQNTNDAQTTTTTTTFFTDPRKRARILKIHYLTLSLPLFLLLLLLTAGVYFSCYPKCI